MSEEAMVKCAYLNIKRKFICGGTTISHSYNQYPGNWIPTIRKSTTDDRMTPVIS
jgi:hypothetical protein